MTRSLSIDFETRSTLDLKDVGVYRYAAEPTTDIWCMAFAFDDEEPELWQKNLRDEIELWIDVGLPDERRVRKACHRAKQVCLYLYGGRVVAPWWQRNADKLQRFANLKVVELTDEATDGLAGLVARSMQLSCTIQDDELWLDDGDRTLNIVPLVRKDWG